MLFLYQAESLSYGMWNVLSDEEREQHLAEWELTVTTRALEVSA